MADRFMLVLGHPWYTIMAGVAVTATLALAGAAAAVSARTGPATSEPTVQIERMVGAIMFRRMRMTASMR